MKDDLKLREVYIESMNDQYESLSETKDLERLSDVKDVLQKIR